MILPRSLAPLLLGSPVALGLAATQAPGQRAGSMVHLVDGST